MKTFEEKLIISAKCLSVLFPIFYLAVIMMKVFQYFAGNLMGQGQAGGQAGGQNPMMDLSQLQKMADKTNILDDKLTNNDVADIFNKVKGKAE